MVLDLDLLHTPTSQHYKTVSEDELTEVFTTHVLTCNQLFADLYFQLYLGGVVICSKLVVSPSWVVRFIQSHL